MLLFLGNILSFLYDIEPDHPFSASLQLERDHPIRVAGGGGGRGGLREVLHVVSHSGRDGEDDGQGHCTGTQTLTEGRVSVVG